MEFNETTNRRLVRIGYHNCVEYLDQQGNLHRDGNKPARVCPGFEKQWWKHGKRYCIENRRDNAIGWNFSEHYGGSKSAINYEPVSSCQEYIDDVIAKGVVNEY